VEVAAAAASATAGGGRFAGLGLRFGQSTHTRYCARRRRRRTRARQLVCGVCDEVGAGAGLASPRLASPTRLVSVPGLSLRVGCSVEESSVRRDSWGNGPGDHGVFTSWPN
jgi:hypothetical protein